MRFKKIRFSLILIITLILITGLSVYGDELKLPNPNKYFYIYDEANIIDNNVKSYIINNNEILYNKTGAQIVVVTVNSLQNTTPQYFANKLFEKWGIGSNERDNGVLILVAPNEKQLWIEVGYGLEGALPDGKVGEIRSNEIFPYFKQGNYNDGILRGFNSIIDIVKSEYNVEIQHNGSSSNRDYESNEENEKSGLFSSIKNILIAIGVVILIIIDFTLFNGFFTFLILRSAFRGGGRGGGGNRGGGGSSGGGGAGGGW